MTRFALPLALLAASALSGCATTGIGAGDPTDVTRHHLGEPVAAGSVVIEPMGTGGEATPEFRTYGDAVANELSRIGFAPAPSGAPATYVAAVSFVRASRGTVRTPPKFSIGIGGGGFGGGGIGLGGGVSTGFGSKTRELLMLELFVQLRRRSDGTVVWEGRAQRPGMSGPDDQPALIAGRMANALFRGFPGESGITTSVR